MVVSEYIDNPLLFNGFKFDLRIYIVITCINPLRIYIYEDGLTRFATSKYSSNVSGNKKGLKYMHLTNFSVNKKNINFVSTDDPNADGTGSKWSLIALKNAFIEHRIDGEMIFRKIEDICIKTILAGEPYMF